MTYRPRFNPRQQGVMRRIAIDRLVKETDRIVPTSSQSNCSYKYNNVYERSNGEIRDRIKVVRGFNSDRSALIRLMIVTTTCSGGMRAPAARCQRRQLESR